MTIMALNGCLKLPNFINGADPILPSNFPYATTEPVKVMAPMKIAKNVSILCSFS